MGEHKLSSGEVERHIRTTIADITSGGGEMQDEKADKFIQVMQDSTPFMQAIRLVPMKSKKKTLPRISFPGPILVGGPGEETEVADVDQQDAGFDDVVLDTVILKGKTSLSDEAIEDNIEEENLETVLMEGFAKRCGIDTEHLSLNGDVLLTGDKLLKMTDGFFKRATAHVVNAAGSAITSALWSQAHRSIPLRHRQAAQGQYRWFTSDHTAQAWKDQLSTRATALGDRLVVSDEIPSATGGTVTPVANIIPVGSPLRNRAILTAPKNLIVGIWKQLKIEPYRDAPKGRWVFFFRMRLGFAIEEPDAVAVITGLSNA